MNTDTQQLIVRGDDIVLRPSAVKRGDVICDYCVLRERDCSLSVTVERCSAFVASLSFLDETGLDGQFSTFRGSAVWYDRARIAYKTHKRIALVRKTGELIGHCRLVDAHRDGFANLMRDHAWSNHLCKGQGLSKEEAAVWLTKWIRTNMGSRYVTDPDAIGTVLCLERVD